MTVYEIAECLVEAKQLRKQCEIAIGLAAADVDKQIEALRLQRVELLNEAGLTDVFAQTSADEETAKELLSEAYTEAWKAREVQLLAGHEQPPIEVPEVLTVIIKPSYVVFRPELLPDEFRKPIEGDAKKIKAGFTTGELKYIPGVEKTVKFEFQVGKENK